MFLPSLRAFIVRQVSGPRCSDNGLAQLLARISDGPLSKQTVSVTSFNTLAAKVDPTGTMLNPITEDEAGKLYPSAFKDTPLSPSVNDQLI